MKNRKIVFFGQAWAGKISQIVATHNPDTTTQIEGVVLTDFVTFLIFLKSCIHADILVRVGFRPGSRSIRGFAIDIFVSILLKVKPKLKLIFYWIGSDVSDAINDHILGRESKFFNRFLNFRHFSGGENLTEELTQIGIQAITLPIPLNLPMQLEESEREWTGKRMTILTYIPDIRYKFYGGDMISEAAKVHQDVDFIIIGGEGKWLTQKSDNVHFMGWVKNTRPYYMKSTHVARLVEHDSLGATVIEGLLLGRRVFYSRYIYGTITVNFGDVDHFIRRISEEKDVFYKLGFVTNDLGIEIAKNRGDNKLLVRDIMRHILL